MLRVKQIGYVMLVGLPSHRTKYYILSFSFKMEDNVEELNPYNIPSLLSDEP
jgi:hypothetical protein